MAQLSDSAGELSTSMLELSTDREENGSKGYPHARDAQAAAETLQTSASMSLATLRDAHASLLRKIADFKTASLHLRSFREKHFFRLHLAL